MALTEAQIAKRPFTLGASEVAAVAGLSPYKTAYDAWHDKVHGRKPPEQRLLDYAEFGDLIEPAIREWYQRRLPEGAYVKTSDTLTHPSVPWATATPDGIVTSTWEDDWGLELKNRGKDDKPRWTDHVPCEVAAQCYWGMYVTGMERWDVVALLNGNTPFQHTLVWRQDVIAALKAVAEHFWRAVQAKTEPEMEWVQPELDFLAEQLVNESDHAAFRRAAYWAKKGSK